MKEMYEAPAMELVEVECEDIILTSGPNSTENDFDSE